MKLRIIQTTLAACALALLADDANAGNAASIGILPSQKIPASIDPGDRNPFAARINRDDNATGDFEAESEESKIRQVFANLQVTGHVPSGGGSPRVLIGDIILKEGAPVPQVIVNQTDELRVTRITSKEVEITWMNQIEVDQPSKMLIPINLEPTVPFILPGSGNSSSGQLVVEVKKNKGDEDESGDSEKDDQSEE